MKYGHVEPQELNQLELALPPDHTDTLKILEANTANKKTEVYVGCAKWGRKEWEGILYPEGLKEKDYLEEYVKHFNALELNGTFYNIKRDNVQSWTEKAKDGFKFCPKFNRRISHIKRLKVDDDFLEYFLDTSLLFGESLGIAFLQLPENYTPKYIDRLEEFLKLVPHDYKLAFEFRHEEWFRDQEVFDFTFDLLKKHNKSCVITDVALRRDILHMRLTTPEVFIRFSGYGINESTYKRIDEWVDRLKTWMKHGIHTIYFFPHQEDETYTPLTCHYFIKKMNEVCGTTIPLPRLDVNGIN